MYLNTLMEKKNISRAELSRRSCVPESTLRDILNGKARLDHCEALTLNPPSVIFSMARPGSTTAKH